MNWELLSPEDLLKRARAGKVVHESKLTIEYIFWIGEEDFNGLPHKVLNFGLIVESSGSPEGFSCFGRLPDLPDVLLLDKDRGILDELETIRRLCTERSVVCHARELLALASYAISGWTRLFEQGDRVDHPIDLLKQINRENKDLAVKFGKGAYQLASDILNVVDMRELHVWFPKLTECHEKLKALWSTASKLAKQARKEEQRRDSWKEEVQDFFARHGFSPVPDDLITRLDERRNWPDDLCKKLADHGADTRPYDIALEHAARLCGCPGYRGYDLTISSLKKQLKSGYEADALKNE
jgi:hypothetical protein